MDAHNIRRHQCLYIIDTGDTLHHTAESGYEFVRSIDKYSIFLKVVINIVCTENSGYYKAQVLTNISVLVKIFSFFIRELLPVG
ncbi:hypothetical protein D9M68_753900 [compost metagenome]